MIRTKNVDVPVITKNFGDCDGFGHVEAQPGKLDEFLVEQHPISEIDKKGHVSMGVDSDVLVYTFHVRNGGGVSSSSVGCRLFGGGGKSVVHSTGINCLAEEKTW